MSYNWNKKDEIEHGKELKDVVVKDEYLLFKDPPFKHELLKKTDNGLYAISVSKGTVNSIKDYGIESKLDVEHKLANFFKTDRKTILKHFVGASPFKHQIGLDKTHYAILDIPLDMVNKIAHNPNVIKSNKGTYYTKIPKELHDFFQSHLRYGADGKVTKGSVMNNRGSDWILHGIGIDHRMKNNANMYVFVKNTFSPEDIKRMKGK